MTDPSEVELDDAPAPPTSTLPEIAGLTPERLVHKLKGSTETLQVLYDHDDRVLLLVEVSPGAVSFSDAKLVLTQTLAADGFYDVTRLDGSIELLRAARSARRAAGPERSGMFALLDDTAQPAGVVDASGVVLTLAEVAEARGFDVDPEGDSITVEFADGTSALWPDDWAGTGQSLAAPGGFMRPPGQVDTVQVIRFLDMASAEVINEWTDEDEDRRLAAAEQEAAADEAAEDIAAVVELESARTKVPLADGAEASVADAPIAAVTKALKASTDMDWVRRVLLIEENGRARKGLVSTARQRLTELEEGGADA